MAIRASDSFKLHIVESKKSFDNFFYFFLFTAPKLWNMFPNNVTCVKNFNAIRTNVVKNLFK